MHVIPVPVGWSAEQAWESIRRGEKLRHPHGEPTWAVVETDEQDRFIGLVCDA